MPRYSESEWNMLLFAPLGAFQTVAAGGSKVIETDWDLLFRILHDSANLENELSREVIADLVGNFETITRNYKEDSSGIGTILQAVAGILESKEDRETANGFKADLVALVLKAVQALEGHQRKSGLAGKRALAYVASSLGIDETLL